MRLIKVAVASVNTTVGAVVSNTDRAIALAREASESGASIVAFQEQLIGGYPPEDLVQWKAFVDSQARELARFARETSALSTVFALGVTVAHAGHRFNCVAVVHAGKILGFVPKEHLANYNVFYEGRVYTKGGSGFFADIDAGEFEQDASVKIPLGDSIFRFDFGVVAFEVCEDTWASDGPMRGRALGGAELVINLSASPYRLGVYDTRREMLATRSADNQVTLVYANAVGGNDSLVFDGGGFVFQNGKLIFAAPRFLEGCWSATVDLDRTSRLRAENSTFRDMWERFQFDEKPRIITVDAPTPDRSHLVLPPPEGKNFFIPSPSQLAASGGRVAFCREVLDAFVMGLGDYYEKSGAFKKIGIALSGGRDSLLTLLIAHRYAVHRGLDIAATLQAFTMPSHITTDLTRQAAETICAELGIPIKTIPITDAYQRELDIARSMLPAGTEPSPITLQNIQTRIRAARMWNWANSADGLWLHTGNMSEKSVGYTTIGGDLEGSYSVLSNVPKTLVVYLLNYLLEENPGAKGIKMTLETTPGPELAADQAGEKELMPYPVLDACFYLFAAEKYAPHEMIAALLPMFPEYSSEQIRAWVPRFVKMFTQSIYKWVQAPMGIHIGNLDLDRERALQIPVIQKREWME